MRHIVEHTDHETVGLSKPFLLRGFLFWLAPPAHRSQLPPNDQDIAAGRAVEYRAGTLARYLASCGQITKDNKELARLRQDKLRELVHAYFREAELSQYLEWINNRGLSRNALEDARSGKCWTIKII